MQYPTRLYADNPNYIPSFYGDDLSDWTPGKNPAFDYCEARCWLAWRDGEIVGRIGAILSHKANDKFGTHRMRFSQVDFVDDSEVSAALFGMVERWAREKGWFTSVTRPRPSAVCTIAPTFGVERSRSS